jgi:hypothetical protein
MGEGMVNCPGCKAEYDGSGYDPGDRFQCPECNTIVTIPGGAKAASTPARPRGNTNRSVRSGGTTRSSRSPSARGGGGMSAKMRIVNEAVGMGALDPTTDPRAIRRASQQAPQVEDKSGEKMMMYGGVGVALIAIVGLIFFLTKGPSAEDKKKAQKEKLAAQAAKTEKEEAAAKASEPEKPKPPVDAGWDADPAIDAEVITTLAILKTHPVDQVFWKTAAKLLRHGRALIPCLVGKWSSEADIANASRLIVERATRRSIPEGLFDTPANRAAMVMEFRHWWVDEPKGQAAQLVSEGEFTGEGGSTPPPVNPPPGGTTEKPPVTPPRPAGGASEAAMRRDLPQQLSNYARGTFEEREKAAAEIRRYGKQVIPALINALKEEDIAMANSANDLLKEFTKQDQGRVPGEPGDRPPFIEKWNTWWKGAEATFTM